MIPIQIDDGVGLIFVTYQRVNAKNLSRRMEINFKLED